MRGIQIMLGINMENYEAKLFSVDSEEMNVPRTHISFGDFATFISIKNNKEYERCLLALAKKLPYSTSSWPSFGEYVEDWYMVDIGEFKKQLLYCERGGRSVRNDCKNLVDLSYQILKIVSPSLTTSALEASKSLHKIDDQRLLIWFRMSSEIFNMYQVNNFFGLYALNENVAWMCEELVRMGTFSNTAEAFKSKKHIIKGLTLSGLSVAFASELYTELANA